MVVSKEMLSYKMRDTNRLEERLLKLQNERELLSQQIKESVDQEPDLTSNQKNYLSQVQQYRQGGAAPTNAQGEMYGNVQDPNKPIGRTTIDKSSGVPVEQMMPGYKYNAPPVSYEQITGKQAKPVKTKISGTDLKNKIRKERVFNEANKIIDNIETLIDDDKLSEVQKQKIMMTHAKKFEKMKKVSEEGYKEGLDKFNNYFKTKAEQRKLKLEEEKQLRQVKNEERAAAREERAAERFNERSKKSTMTTSQAYNILKEQQGGIQDLTPLQVEMRKKALETIGLTEKDIAETPIDIPIGEQQYPKSAGDYIPFIEGDREEFLNRQKQNYEQQNYVNKQGKQQFKAGEIRFKNGIKYQRNEAGQWFPIQ